MKVKELIAALQKYDQELTVSMGYGDQFTNEPDSMAVETDTKGQQILAIQCLGEHHELPMPEFSKYCEQDNAKLPDIMEETKQEMVRRFACPDCGQVECICGVGM